MTLKEKKLFKLLFSQEGEKGGVLVEYAFMLPLLILLSLPVVDYGRLILIRQKAVKTASFMADAVAMSREIANDTTAANVATDATYMTPQALQAIVSSLNVMMMPFPPEQPGGPDLYRAVITHVYKDPNTGGPVLGWQFDQNSMSFYDSNRISTVGLVANVSDIGKPANIPPSLANNLDDGENLIVAEVSVFFDPITPDLGVLGVPFLTQRWMTYTAYFRARYGNLKCVWQVYMPPQPDCLPVSSGSSSTSSSGGSGPTTTSSTSSGGSTTATSSGTSGGTITPASSTSSGGSVTPGG